MIRPLPEPVLSVHAASTGQRDTFVYCVSVYARIAKWGLVKDGYVVATADKKAEATKWFKENR